MNNFARRIENKISKGKKISGKKSFEDILFVLVKKTSMNLQDICSAPTPLILTLSEHLRDYYKQQNKKR